MMPQNKKNNCFAALYLIVFCLLFTTNYEYGLSLTSTRL